MAVLAAVAVGLVGCSTSRWDTSEIDDVTSTTQKIYARDTDGLIEAITDRYSTEPANLNVWAAPRAEARCAAERIVEQLGADRLLQLGFDPQKGQLALPYTDAEQNTVLNLLVGCIDFEHGLVEMLSAYDKLSLESSACVSSVIERRGLTRELASGLLSGSEPDPFSNDNRLGAGVTAAMLECLDPGEDLLPVAPQDPFPDADLGTATTSTLPAPTTTEG